MDVNALVSVPTASQAVLRVGWFTLHGTAALMPLVLLLWLVLWMHSAHSTRKH